MWTHLSILHWRCFGLAVALLIVHMLDFQYSIGDAPDLNNEVNHKKREAFNTPLEMLGVLVFGFCGFLSFCVGVCGFLVGAC